MKRLVTLLIALFFSTMAYGQNSYNPETYYGIKFGQNVSGIISSPTIRLRVNYGLMGGVVFKHIAEKGLGVQVELNFKQSGWNEDLDSTSIYQRQLNYLELPFMTHINLGNQRTRFVINLGPYISYLLWEKEIIDLPEEVQKNDYYGTETDNKAGFGICLGTGISQNTSIGSFQVEVRVTAGLTDIFKKTTGLSISASKNLNAELSLSYML